MSELERLPRSPELMSRTDTGLLVVDVQAKLVPLIHDHPTMVFNIDRLIDGAGVLGLPMAVTEQYPQGLGSTIPELAAKLPAAPSKLHFSCGGCPQVFSQLREQGSHKLLVVGMEAHVCVQQTVMDLLTDGWRVYLAVDALGSRGVLDEEIALRRMESAGATLTTTEAALFEWCDVSGTPEFKQISQLVRKVQGT